MILADKIIENRKKNGWSQEELAEKLGVSRQSVSKWEGAQSMPDMKRILQLAEVFGVSTDYLLKDEIEEKALPEIQPAESDSVEDPGRKVSMEEANRFLEWNEHAAAMISTGVMICILSPLLVIVLEALANAGRIPFNEYTAGLIGVTVLLAMVAVAVAIFISCGLRGKPYEYLETDNIDTEYGVNGMVKERKSAYSETHNRLLILGIMLCVMSAIPMFLIMAVRNRPDSGITEAVGTGLLLLMVALGVKMIVLTCIRHGGMDKLLEEGDYTRLNKKIGKYDGIYWAIATAVHLGWSFVTQRWDFTWIVWPVAGVLYAAYREILKLIVKK